MVRNISSAVAFVILVIALGFSGPGLAEDSSTDDCAKTACREGGFNLAIAVDKDHYTTIPVTHSPYVLPDGSILIFPGETLVFELPMEEEKIGIPKFVAEYLPERPAERDPQAPSVTPRDLPKLDKTQLPANSFVLSYGPMGREPGMNLDMWQNSPKTVKVDAVMSVIRRDKYIHARTSTCPLMPKIIGFEMWQDPMGPMILQNIRILPDGSGMVCD